MKFGQILISKTNTKIFYRDYWGNVKVNWKLNIITGFFIFIGLIRALDEVPSY